METVVVHLNYVMTLPWNHVKF